MGADRGSDVVVAGALEAASATVKPIIYGPSGLDTQGLELVEASDLYREIVEKGLPDQVFLTRKPEEAEVAGL